MESYHHASERTSQILLTYNIENGLRCYEFRVVVFSRDFLALAVYLHLFHACETNTEISFYSSQKHSVSSMFILKIFSLRKNTVLQEKQTHRLSRVMGMPHTIGSLDHVSVHGCQNAPSLHQSCSHLRGNRDKTKQMLSSI